MTIGMPYPYRALWSRLRRDRVEEAMFVRPECSRIHRTVIAGAALIAALVAGPPAKPAAAQASGYSYAQPNYSYQQPAATSTYPNYSYQQPTAASTYPNYSYQQPAVQTPGYSYQQPYASSSYPNYYNQAYNPYWSGSAWWPNYYSGWPWWYAGW